MENETNNQKIIRVAQVIGITGCGGVEACIMNYYKKIDKTKVQFDFFVESTSKIIDKDKIEAMGGRVIFIPSYKKIFKYIKTLKKLFKEGNYDIVHSNMNALSVFTLYAAKKAGIKVRIAHSHSTSNKKEWKKTLLKTLLRPFSKKYATDYFACSELAGRWLFGNKTYDSGKVTLIKNAIDLEKFKFDANVRENMRKDLGVEDKVVIGHIGRFMPQKNHTFLIDVFYEYQKINENSNLLLVGDGPLRQEMVQKTKKLKIYDKVIFAGVHKHTERYYQGMDLFLFPSLYEGLGIALVEAQATGLPCIVSTEVPVEAKVNDNVDFIKLSDPATYWAEAISKSDLDCDRLEFYQKLKSASFDIENEANKLLNFYIKMVG